MILFDKVLGEKCKNEREKENGRLRTEFGFWQKKKLPFDYNSKELSVTGINIHIRQVGM